MECGWSTGEFGLSTGEHGWSTGEHGWPDMEEQHSVPNEEGVGGWPGLVSQRPVRMVLA